MLINYLFLKKLKILNFIFINLPLENYLLTLIINYYS